MFVKENAEKTSWLITWPHFYGEMSQPKEVQVTCTVPCFHNLLKRIFVHVNRQRLFSTNKESISKLIAKKMKKKRHPDPERAFYWTQSPTHNMGCLLMISCSFSSLLNCTSPCGSNSRSPQDLYCKSCWFLELAPHGEVQFNKDEKLQDAVLINMVMLDKYWKMQHWVLKLVRFVCFLH